jgi:pimeloyl-ACP methyl ester carboxylesterase
MIEQLRSNDGTAIALETVGEGPAVVLVDGAFGSRAWGPNVGLAPLLALHFSVHRYDRRGRGDSGDDGAFEAAREIEDLDCVIEATGGPAFVFGTSSGGNLALRAAVNGAAISKLALWEPNFLVGDLRSPLPSDYVEHLRGLVVAGRRGDAVEYFMTAAVGLPGEFVGPMRELPMWPALEAAAHTLAYDGAIVAPDMTGDKPSRAEWAPVAVAALVLDGATTPWLSQGADALASALPNAQRRTLAGQQHDVEAAALAPVLIEFFQPA